MKEEFLHYIWKTKNFSHYELKTTKRESIEMESYGFHNDNAGPDFLQGKVTINGTMWFGHIEIHVKASEWNQHGHQHDDAYQNVVLHVVYEEDVEILRPNGTRIPCLTLKGRIDPDLIESYNLFMKYDTWVPCAYYLNGDQMSSFYFQRHRLFIERQEVKSKMLFDELERNNYDWNQLLFFLIARAMGSKVNADAMAMLTMKTPVNLLFKLAYNPLQLEALLLGQAGMLMETEKNEHADRLSKEYKFLKNKYQLTSMTGKEWKMLRMRPSSFPPLRVALLAAVYGSTEKLHQTIFHLRDPKEIKAMLDVQASSFWNSHYTLYKESKQFRPKYLTEEVKNLIIINAIIPFLFTKGTHMNDNSLIEQALDLAMKVPAEKNKIIKNWKALGVESKNALDTQAFLHLKNNYCEKRKCLSCQFGNQVLKQISQKVKSPGNRISA